MTDAAISIQNLQKTYAGGKTALHGVSFDVPRGQIFGLLGPNGAGKSTLINILAGLVNKTGGTAEIWGFDIEEHPRNAKRAIGIVPQEILFDPFFSPREALEICAGLYGVPKAERRTLELLRAVHLEDKADAYVRELNARGTTVVLTTHYLEEAQELCDRIAIINHGRLIANEPTGELLSKAQEKVVEVTVDRDVIDMPNVACFEKTEVKG